VTFEELIGLMVDAEVAQVQADMPPSTASSFER
jgi:hypothetical protein